MSEPRRSTEPGFPAWEAEELRLPLEMPRRPPTNTTAVIDYGDDGRDPELRDEPARRVIVIDIA